MLKQRSHQAYTGSSVKLSHGTTIIPSSSQPIHTTSPLSTQLRLLPGGQPSTTGATRTPHASPSSVSQRQHSQSSLSLSFRHKELSLKPPRVGQAQSSRRHSTRVQDTSSRVSPAGVTSDDSSDATTPPASTTSTKHHADSHDSTRTNHQVPGETVPPSQSSQSSIPQITGDPFLSPLHSLLSQRSPGFPVAGDHIKVIPTPHDFYQTLLTSLASAKHRICLSSLYLGTDEEELQLINVIDDALRKNPDLRVHTLFDRHRGQRVDKHGRSSHSMFVDLSLKYPGRVSSALFTPPSYYSDPTDGKGGKGGSGGEGDTKTTDDGFFARDSPHSLSSRWYRMACGVRGLLRSQVRGRAKELFSVHHMKAYTIDDTTIISGANLSKIYFTNRQDRYVHIHDKPLSDFITSVIQTLSYDGAINTESSFVPEGSATVVPTPPPFMDSPTSSYFHFPPHKTVSTSPKAQVESLRALFSPVPVRSSPSEGAPSQSTPLTTPPSLSTPASSPRTFDTVIFPTIQLPSMGIRHDENTTKDVVTAMAMRSIPSHPHAVHSPSNPSTQSTQSTHPTQGLDMYIATGYFNMSHVFVDLFDTISQRYKALSSSSSSSSPSSSSSTAATVTATPTLLTPPRLNVSIMAASKEANGWYKASGITGYVPDVYKSIITEFNEMAQRRWNTPTSPHSHSHSHVSGSSTHTITDATNATNTMNAMDTTNATPQVDIKAVEYTRDGWSFHAKGIYAQPQQYPHESTSTTPGQTMATTATTATTATIATTAPATTPDEDTSTHTNADHHHHHHHRYLDPSKPLFTTIGSSNYGVRSIDLDSELQFAMLTTNPQLIAQFDEDLHRTLAYSRVEPPEHLHWKGKLIKPILKHFL